MERNPTDNVISCIWLFKVKEKVDGFVDRLKARLVVNGMNQIESLDYNETFSLVVKLITTRLVLSIALTNN